MMTQQRLLVAVALAALAAGTAGQTTAAACVDKSASCQTWLVHCVDDPQELSTFYAFMQNFCAATCGFCQTGPAGQPGTSTVEPSTGEQDKLYGDYGSKGGDYGSKSGGSSMGGMSGMSTGMNAMSTGMNAMSAGMNAMSAGMNAMSGMSDKSSSYSSNTGGSYGSNTGGSYGSNTGGSYTGSKSSSSYSGSKSSSKSSYSGSKSSSSYSGSKSSSKSSYSSGGSYNVGYIHTESAVNEHTSSSNAGGYVTAACAVVLAAAVGIFAVRQYRKHQNDIAMDDEENVKMIDESGPVLV